jgi:hypothetical protein
MALRYTAQQVADALTECKGLMFMAARHLGCSHQTLLNYCKRYEVVAQARATARGEMLDLAESKLWSAIQAGESWAIMFALKTQGKERGYVERQEVTGEGNQPVRLEVTYVDTTPPDVPATAASHLAHPPKAGNGHERGGR